MIKKKSKKLLAAVLALTCSLTLTSSIVAQAFTPLGIDYETDYFSLEEAHAEAADLRREIVDEGTVLLKNNNNALPIAGNSWVTGLGDAGSDLQSGFEASGMHIQIIDAANPDRFTAEDKVRMRNGYNDAAIIVMSGSGGSEGLSSGVVSSEVEDNKFGDKELSYSHKHPITGPAKTSGGQGQGGFAPFSTEGGSTEVEYKHVLQVTEDTEDLIIYAAEHFKKVIVIVCAGTSMEIRCLQESDLVDAIFWTGTRSPSADAFEEIARMISGEVNPSGRLPDNWATDFTANPSWMNDGNSISFSSAEAEGAYEYSISSTKAFRLSADGEYYTRQQHGANVVDYVYGIKYEEDIYNGYRYYETAAADGVINYKDSVLYPFGYGLSYTSFEWTYNAKKSDLSAWNSAEMIKGGSFNGTVKIAVDVKNTGSVAGKDVVQIYGHSPYYNGEVEKSEVVLVGFEKTGIIAPGKTETVIIEVQIRDLASFDYTDANGNGKKTYELDASSDDNPYELRIQKNSHDKVLTVKLDNLANDVILDKDGYTGNTVETLFSNNDEYNLLGHDPAVEGEDKTLVGDGKMTLMSRTDFEGTYPEMDTAEDMVRSQAYFDFITEFPEYEADNWKDYYKLINGEEPAAGLTEDIADFVWSITEVPETWSQMADAEAQAKAKAEAGDKWLNFADLRGVAWDDAKWDKLLNELTYEEMVELVSYGAYRTIPLDSIGKVKARYMDGANMVDIETDNVMNWGDVPTTAATWNKDLAYRRGIISANIGMHSSVAEGMDAWYAPAVCTHRSPFGGRNPEYFSEDPFLAGHMAGHLVAGLEERGVMTTIKHYALNENENQRRGVQTYVSEQAAREIYFKPFQIVVQQYGGRCMMTSYNQVGDMASSSNYMFMNKMTRQEWGFNGNSMTDAVAPQSDFFTMDSLIRGGSSLVLSSFYGTNAEKYANCAISGYYDAENNCVKVADGTVSKTQWYWLRMATKSILFAEVDSRVVRNGLDLSGYNNDGKVTDLGVLTQGESVGSSGGKGKGDFGGGGSTVDAPKVTYELAEQATKNARNSTTYTVIEGTLPDGMELSESGSLNGTPTKAGTYEFTVQIQCYGWLKETAKYSITIESAFETEDDITNLTVGDKVDTLLFTDVLKAEDYNESYTYSVESGSLPSGLTINAEGEIVGTPTVAGVYSATIKLTAVKSSTNHAGLVTITTDEIYHDITIVVSAKEVEVGSKVNLGSDGYLYIDGVKTNITACEGSVVTVGEDGYLYIDGVKTIIYGAVAPAGGDKVEESSGCGGYVGIGATLALLAMAGVVYANKKRKENN